MSVVNLYSAFPVLLTTQRALQYKPHSYGVTIHSFKSVLRFHNLTLVNACPPGKRNCVPNTYMHVRVHTSICCCLIIHKQAVLS